ncbi:19270_t:CDS:2, partial [Racocetra persica]
MSEKSWHIEVLYPIFRVLVSGLKYLKFKMDESFTESSREASRELSSPSNLTTISSSSCSNSDNYISESEFVFVNLNAEHFSETGNTTNGIRPDGQLICESILSRFKMEVGSLESSKPASSSFNKKECDEIKLKLAMLMSGAYIRHNFNPSYMSLSVQKLLEGIEYVTLQVHNERLIAHIYDFTYSPIKIRQALIDVSIPKLRKCLENIDANFGLLASRFDDGAPPEPLINKKKVYQKFIHLKLSELLAK